MAPGAAGAAGAGVRGAASGGRGRPGGAGCGARLAADASDRVARVRGAAGGGRGRPGGAGRAARRPPERAPDDLDRCQMPTRRALGSARAVARPCSVHRHAVALHIPRMTARGLHGHARVDPDQSWVVVLRPCGGHVARNRATRPRRSGGPSSEEAPGRRREAPRAGGPSSEAPRGRAEFRGAAGPVTRPPAGAGRPPSSWAARPACARLRREPPACGTQDRACRGCSRRTFGRSVR